MPSLSQKLYIAPVLLMLSLLLIGLTGAVAADPGSKDDPLATVSYVRQHAQFVHVELAGGMSLRLGPGAEFVYVSPEVAPLSVSELNMMADTIVDLTDGSILRLAELTGGHHYLNASQHDIFVRPAEEALFMVRGEFK